MKKQRKVVIIFASLLVLVLLGVYFGSMKTISISEQYSSIGDIKYEFSTCGWLCQLLNPVEQTVFISTAEMSAGTISKNINAKVGDTVKLYSTFTCDVYSGATSNELLNAIVITHIGNEKLATPIQDVVNHKVTYQLEYYKPIAAGSYEVWNEIKCYKKGSTTIADYKSYDSIKRNLVVTAEVTCPTNRKNKDLPSSAIGYSNVLQFTCEEWYLYSQPNCELTTSIRNCNTVCKPDSYCDVSYTEQLCNGKVSCVQKPVVQIQPPITSITPEPIVPATGQTPSTTTPTSTTPVTTTTPSTSTSTTPSQTNTGTTSQSATKDYPTSTILSWVIVIVLGILLGIIIYIVIRRRK